jgi:hypothetical protein
MVPKVSFKSLSTQQRESLNLTQVDEGGAPSVVKESSPAVPALEIIPELGRQCQ